ncbi:MAG: hypothetical protein KHZ36_07250 [Clostridiaceae bacterium]|nr:hypothetical protein [Clostridiaceae bacterium]
MGQSGIYCGPIDTSPNRDRETCLISNVPMRLWILEFNVIGVGKGCAVVKAGNPKQAEGLLKAQGVFNGRQHLYEVTRVEEIIEPPCAGLLAEQVVEIQRGA